MKRMIMSIIAMLAIAASASAMSYEQARREALFLTDKMAYELNLNDQQYEAAYEINLDYLMGVTGRDDVYGTYWTRRNADFGYILLDWQWNAFCAATYFYRPLYWRAGYWHFGIYSRYPRRDYFYFGRPTVYVSYCGGHSWRSNGGRSYYHGRSHEFRHNTAQHSGMRDRWNNGNLRNRNNIGSANSSTHITVNNGSNSGGSRFGSSKTGGAFSGSRTTGATQTGTGSTPEKQTPAGGATTISRTHTATQLPAGSAISNSRSISTIRPQGSTTVTPQSNPTAGGSTTAGSSVRMRSNTGVIGGSSASRTSGTTRMRSNATISGNNTRASGGSIRQSSTSRISASPARISSAGSAAKSSGNGQKSSGGFAGRR